MSVLAWLEDFATCVRARDVDAARLLFDPACVSFGTRAEVARGIDDLVDHQWAPVWAGTRGFWFTEVVMPGDGHDLAVAATRWSSTVDLDGRVRTGRATLALRSDPTAAHGWLCVHTHFSATPVLELL